MKKMAQPSLSSSKLLSRESNSKSETFIDKVSLLSLQLYSRSKTQSSLLSPGEKKGTDVKQLVLGMWN